MSSKKDLIQGTSLAPKKEIASSIPLSINGHIEEAVKQIHAKEKGGEEEMNNISDSSKKPVSKANKDQSEVVKKKRKAAVKPKNPVPVSNVQVPTGKDLYLRAKSYVLDNSEVKGMKYLYLDALEHYLKSKGY